METDFVTEADVFGTAGADGRAGAAAAAFAVVATVAALGFFDHGAGVAFDAVFESAILCSISAVGHFRKVQKSGTAFGRPDGKRGALPHHVQNLSALHCEN